MEWYNDTWTVLRCIVVEIWKSWLKSLVTYRADNSHTQSGVNCEFEVKFDLEGQGYYPHPTPPHPQKKNEIKLKKKHKNIWDRN